MIQKLKRILIILSPIIILIVWNNFFPTWILTGTYVSNNPHPVLEGPSGIDTLTLYSDGTFTSGWADGKWIIEDGKWKARYQYTYGTAGYSMPIYRPFFLGTPRIRLDRDLNYYYLKIE